ncbi:MAG: response regulator [Bacteroidales bacterium]
MRVLIVDDDIDYSLSLKEMIEEEGHEVTVTNSPTDALNLENLTPFDIMITDIIMPEMDGLGVIQYVKATHPSTKIIAISGGGYFSASDLLMMAREFGASMVLSKPFSFSTLRVQLNAFSVTE